MSQYEFESNHDGDWDDNEEVAWNEADWQDFLRKSDKEVARFITVYNKVKKNNSPHLDQNLIIKMTTLLGCHL